MSESELKNARTEATEGSSDFRVVVFSRASDQEQMAEALEKTLGLNRIDARVHTAHTPGVLPDRLDRSQAESVVEAVNNVGVPAAVVTRADIPNLAHPVVVHHASCSEQGLEIAGLRGDRVRVIPWPELDFVSAGHIPAGGTRFPGSDLSAVPHTAPHTIEEQLKLHPLSGPVCWLITDNPGGVYFVDHNQMNYDYLGDRKTTSATANFSEFLKDITRYATGAFLTPSTRALLDHQPLRDYTFRDSEHFRQRTLLQYLGHRVSEGGQLPDHH